MVSAGRPKVGEACRDPAMTSSLSGKRANLKPARVSRLVQSKRAVQNQRPHSQGRDEEHQMKKLTFGALVALSMTAAASGAMAQDVTAGKASFNKCLACHAIGEGAKNKVGPELNGLDGRHSGT